MGKRSATFVLNSMCSTNSSPEVNKGQNDQTCPEDGKENVRLRKEVGLLEGTAITIGSIIGSGIFVSPKGVVMLTGSVGISLLVWVLCGVMSFLGSMCYAELGVTFPTSGGDYQYIQEAFGPVPAFMFLWSANIMFVPATNAILALTFAQYVTQPFFALGCDVPHIAVQLLAGAAVFFLTFLNCYDVRITTRMQNIFMYGKLTALIIIIITGIVAFAYGHTENFQEPWKGSILDPGSISAAFYSGLFAYTGWNTLNFMTEELKNPTKNLPRAIYISVPVVTFIYVFANVAYFSVISPEEMLKSNAIAVTFGQKLLGVMAWTMPVFVAMSAFGGLSVHIMTSSRLLFAGARQGHFPSLLSLIKVSRMTPTPSLIFLGILSCIYLCIPSVYTLINFATFVTSLVSLFSIAALMYLRWKKPDLERPLKVSIFYPISYFIICVFLCVVPIYVRPWEVLFGIVILLTSLPIYALLIYRAQPKFLEKIMGLSTKLIQKIFVSLPED